MLQYQGGSVHCPLSSALSSVQAFNELGTGDRDRRHDRVWLMSPSESVWLRSLANAGLNLEISDWTLSVQGRYSSTAVFTDWKLKGGTTEVRSSDSEDTRLH